MKHSYLKRFISVFLCIALIMTYLPVLAKAAAVPDDYIVGTVTDPGTADTWEQMMGSSADGNRYAGRVWVDKSVYKDGDTAVLNSRGEAGSSFQVSLEDDEAFQIIFSALGSSMTTTTTTSSTGPMDVVIVLDNSSSMGRYTDVAAKYSRLEAVTDASNELIAQILESEQNRLAVVTYSTDSTVILPLNHYEQNNKVLTLSTWTKNNPDNNGGVKVEDGDGKMTASATILGTNTVAGATNTGFQRGTNLQSGIDAGMSVLNNATDTANRTPVLIVLTDGVADTAVTSYWYDTDSGRYVQPEDNTITSGVALSTLLNASYWKSALEDKYGKSPVVYGVGVDLGSNSDAEIVMNPAAAFKPTGTSVAQTAYSWFTAWQTATDATTGTDSYRTTWTFNQLPASSTVTKQDVINNINYVDTYYPVSSAALDTVFDQIFEELSSGVFNPISDSTTIDGATGVDNTPLIYVDWIGQYMEIKEIEAVTLFGASYSVINNGDGTYTVATGTGTNPATKEEYNTSEDIIITVTEENGVQKLEIKINQEILPILMEQVISKTVSGATTATITEVMQDPLRVYYTVGIDSDILLANGEIDVSKIQGYEYIDDTNGTVSFYSNRFGVKNAAVNDVVTAGDAHVGFKPSAENRYYYHQANQRIFSAVTNSDGSAITWDTDLYGVLYKEGSFNLTDLDYATYLKYNADLDNASNPVDHQVYTYVSFYRPTVDQTDAANAAELVTYLVYTNWSDLRESVSFYDATTGKYVNYSNGTYTLDDAGYVMTAEQAAAYVASNSSAKLYAVLGMGSLRTSRFHNMIKAKTENLTGTATLRYDPEYTYGLAAQHNNNDVVVWLGNNGKLTVAVDTGIALTKNVTEAIGNADDTYALTVTVPSGVTATPVVTDATGNNVTASISTYLNNVLTVNLKAGETVYISGIPGGTVCTIGENIPDSADYYIASKTETVTVPTVSEALNGTAQFVPAQVTNAPNKYGNLYITKEITGDYEIPDSILEKEFTITVNTGTALAGKTFTIDDSAAAETYTKTVDANGNMVFTIKARQTVEILNLPAGTQVTVTEADPGTNFEVSYRTRNHSSADADSDNTVTIPEGADATAVVTNRYTPTRTSVDLSIAGTKNFVIEGSHSGGTFNFKVQKWNGSEWVDVSGKTASVSYEESASGIKSFTIDDVLDGIEYTHVGTWAYQVLEVKGSIANVTYDRTLYTFTVTVTDNGGQLVATVTDVNNTAITDGSYEVTFKNTYNTAPISMDITKEVVNKSGDNAVSKAGFKFRSKAVDAYGNALNPDAPETATNAIYTDAAGKARISGYYTTTGTYYYIVWEDASANLPGWTYSQAEYFITVVVSDDGTGNLSSRMTITPWNDAAKAELSAANVTADALVTNGNEGHLYFTNTYDPDDVTVNLDGAVAKELTGKTLEAGMFTFYVFNNSKVDRSDYTKALFSGTNNLNGEVKFVDFADVLTFDKVGKYEYDIVEYIPEGAVLNTVTGMYELNGMSYDPTIYDLVVEVTLDTANGKLAASCYFEDAVGQVVTFHNKYEVTPTTYQFGGLKTLNGRAMQAGEFSFGLYRNGTLIETVTNKADGSFLFSAITYTEAGTYTYTIKEIEPATKAPGVTYDDSEITVKVTVTDSNGILSAAANVSNANIKFANTYLADPVYVDFDAHKTLKGQDLQSNMFFFKLYATDSSFTIPANAVALAAVDCDANGVAELNAVKFEKTGTYFFAVIEETENPIDGIVYDTTQHNYIVTVRDHGAGRLEATVQKVGNSSSVSGYGTVNAPVANFENATFDEVVEKEVAAKSAPEINIDGSKVNAGEILTYYITYTNYTGEAVAVDIMDTIPRYTSYVEGSASHNGSYAGTHILWTMNVADGASVTVTFDVRVDETQIIVTNTAVIRDGVNTYKTNEVVNHTVDEELVKDVFSPDDITVSIDGRKVYSGDELLYKVSFTNASADAVNITITDKIPANTTYVTDSADNGGVYSNGQITWTIDNVPAWQTVTVSFKVKVNENVGAVTVENKATATDGTNSYETDVVSNYTVEDDVEKKVFAADNTEVNIDGKKVYVGDILIYSISYTNSATEKATVKITDTIPEHTAYVDNSADNGGVYSDGVISWDLEAEPGATITVTFKVSVNENAKTATIANKAIVQDGKNIYETNEVTNYTTEDEVKKQVFNANAPAVSIDGQEVAFGDTLIYAISYKNTSAEKVTVTIMDTVPAHTAYVSGSADHDGMYEDGVVTWTLEVEVGETVTVSFKAKVEWVQSATITNKATVLEGKNTYTTNEVSNPTSNNVPNIPKTGDNTNLALWITLMFISGGAVITLGIYGKKKEILEEN